MSKLFSKRNEKEFGYEGEQERFERRRREKVQMTRWEAKIHGKIEGEMCSTEGLKAFKDTELNIQCW